MLTIARVSRVLFVSGALNTLLRTVSGSQGRAVCPIFAQAKKFRYGPAPVIPLLSAARPAFRLGAFSAAR